MTITKSVCQEQEFFDYIIFYIEMDLNLTFTSIAIKPWPANIFGKRGFPNDFLSFQSYIKFSGQPFLFNLEKIDLEGF